MLSLTHCLHLGLIHKLQQKMAPHGLKLCIPGLDGVSESSPHGPESSEPGLIRLLAMLCDLELNGNLSSELAQTVGNERACLLQDGLLRGLLDGPALRHCVDIAMENSAPGKIKVLEVRNRTNKSVVYTYWQLKFPMHLLPGAIQ